MRSWNFAVRASVGAALLLLTGCGLVAITDSTADPQEPLSAAALVITPSAKGSGFLLDRSERLLVTSAGVVGNSRTAEVIFPAMHNGKVRIKRDYYLTKAPRIKATVIANNSQDDLAVLRLESVPEDAVELKVAPTGCRPEEHVRLIGDVARRSQIWGATETTVRTVGDQKLTFDKQKVSTRIAQLEAPASEGKSTRGGPLVNDAGEVVGVVSGSAGDPPQLVAVDGNELRYFLGVVFRKLATSAMKDRDHKLALALCDKALAMRPNDPLAHNERGAALSWLERYDEAIAAYTEAIKHDPKMALAFSNRGSANFHKGKFQDAVDDCTHAIQLQPNYVKAYETRRKAYLALNKTAEARADEEHLRQMNKVEWKATSPFPDDWFPN